MEIGSSLIFLVLINIANQNYKWVPDLLHILQGNKVNKIINLQFINVSVTTELQAESKIQILKNEYLQ